MWEEVLVVRSNFKLEPAQPVPPDIPTFHFPIPENPYTEVLIDGRSNFSGINADPREPEQ